MGVVSCGKLLIQSIGPSTSWETSTWNYLGYGKKKREEVETFTGNVVDVRTDHSQIKTEPPHDGIESRTSEPLIMT